MAVTVDPDLVGPQSPWWSRGRSPCNSVISDTNVLGRPSQGRCFLQNTTCAPSRRAMTIS